MKYLILLVLLLSISCATTSNRQKVYTCTKSLIERKVEATKAMDFCKDTFRAEDSWAE